MFTDAGIAWLLQRMLEGMAGARIYVTDNAGGKHSERADLSIEDNQIVLKATFGGDVANYDWKHRAVILPDQTVIDEIDLDGGRKVAGQVWNEEYRISPVAEEG